MTAIELAEEILFLIERGKIEPNAKIYTIEDAMFSKAATKTVDEVSPANTLDRPYVVPGNMLRIKLKELD